MRQMVNSGGGGIEKSWLKCVVGRKMNELYDRMNESEDDKIISFYNNFLLDEIYSSTSNTFEVVCSYRSSFGIA